ncbi:hypothetical protein NQ318_009554 [Aromia moschata]|uniref:CRAL-TRIO domain-containing protein n=1 Tax=Aromia moschata TaxID=1265417 RepID=A0AAV8Y811_9CUCU|nr:hypothetical protein NQ318_009554 [Aromia moschata]
MSTKDLLITDRQKVRDAFEKTVKDVEKDVEIVRNWIKTQPHLPETPDYNMIEWFLVNNKFSIERTKEKLDMYYTIRGLIPEMYDNTTPTSPRMQKARKLVLTCPLPKLTKDLYRVHVIKIVGEPEEFNFYDMCAYILNTLEVRLHEDLALGDIYIGDYEKLKMGHVVKITPVHMKKLSHIFEKVLSNRIKGIHVIQSPSYVDIVVNIAKSVLKPKLARRIHVHDRLEALYEYVSKDVLPSEYGGEERPLKELIELWDKKLEENCDRFDKLSKMRVNEELRPEPLKNDEILGFHGNFKKLDVD